MGAPVEGGAAVGSTVQVVASLRQIYNCSRIEPDDGVDDNGDNGENLGDNRKTHDCSLFLYMYIGGAVSQMSTMSTQRRSLEPHKCNSNINSNSNSNSNATWRQSGSQGGI